MMHRIRIGFRLAKHKSVNNLIHQDVTSLSAAAAFRVQIGRSSLAGA